MAAVLKKRALAEYGDLAKITEPSWKRFKISFLNTNFDPSDVTDVGLLENCKTSNEAMQALLDIPVLDKTNSEDFQATLKCLSDHFNQQPESAVRAKILLLLGTFTKVSETEIEAVVELILELIALETSHKVIAAGLSTISFLLSTLPRTSLVLGRIVEAAKQFLKDTNHYVKSICFFLLASINDVEDISLISSYIIHQDARVRSSALETLEMLHNNGNKLGVFLYTDACGVLNDDYEIVRVAALKLVCLIGNTYPENEVMIEGSKKVRLIDDAFLKVCQGITDSSCNVRNTAVNLLGTMVSVSTEVLNQTLNKKLMSNMRKKESFHERTNKLISSGEWLRGKKWANDLPQGLLHKDEVSIVVSGTYGALIHGLEDESMEIRCSSVNALRSLTLAHPRFAPLSLDFLVDMLSDEIEIVSLRAIDSLSCMTHHVVIREHQLETILGVLEDSSIRLREGLHRMLASCTLSSKECLQICIEGLVRNLKRYPSDKTSTWNCAKDMGKAHSDLMLYLAPRILGIHPYFETPERNVDDPCYITLLIFVLNAAEHCPTIISLLDENVIKHYTYLRGILPSFVPHLILDESVDDFLEAPNPGTGLSFLWNLIESFSVAPLRMSDSILQQLDTLARIDSTVAGPTKFTSMFISCQVLLYKILKNKLWCSNNLNNLHNDVVKSDLERVLSMCLKLQHLFFGLDIVSLGAVKHLQLLSGAVYLSFILKTSKLPQADLTSNFINKIKHSQQFFTENYVTPNEFCEKLFSGIKIIDSSMEREVATLLRECLSKDTEIKISKPSHGVHMCQASLSMLQTSQDMPLKFTAGLVLAVDLDAIVVGLQRLNTLRIKIHYPNDETQFIMPSESSLKGAQAEGDYNLHCQIFLCSQSSWSDTCYVEISLCIVVPEDNSSSLDCYNLKPYLELCKPSKLYIRVKPFIQSSCLL